MFGDFCSGEIFLLEDGVMRVLLATPFQRAWDGPTIDDLADLPALLSAAG